MFYEEFVPAGMTNCTPPRELFPAPKEAPEYMLLHEMEECLCMLLVMPGAASWHSRFWMLQGLYYRALADGKITHDILGEMLDDADRRAEVNYCRNCGTR